MKSNSVTTILQGVLAFSILLSVIFSGQYFFKSREVRHLSLQAAGVQQLLAREQPAVNQLVAETIEYSKRNPAIDPVLISMGVKPNTGAAKPATK